MPNKADELLADIETRIRNQNFEAACHSFEELADWLSDGGELPEEWKQYTVGR